MQLILCKHLNGPEYEDYISLTHTRQYGGISPTLIAQIMRCSFPYKNFLLLDGDDRNWKDLRNQFSAFSSTDERHINKFSVMDKWTKHERKSFQTVLRTFSRWEVDYTCTFIKSTHCEEKTTNEDGICDPCYAVSRDKSLQHAVRKVSPRSSSMSGTHANFDPEK